MGKTTPHRKMAALRLWTSTLGRCTSQVFRNQQGLLSPMVISCSRVPPPPHQHTASTMAAQFHTSDPRTDLMEFFDRKENWGEEQTITGRPYRKDELRIKSNEDLHKLWYVLLKERNMLLTMQAEYARNNELFPNPERIEKVEESMENILAVVKERDEAVAELETGQASPRPEARYVRDFLGRVVYRKVQEYAVPPHMNKAYNLLYPKGFNRQNLPYLALWREKVAKHGYYHYHKRMQKNKDLVKRFPHLEGKFVEKL